MKRPASKNIGGQSSGQDRSESAGVQAAGNMQRPLSNVPIQMLPHRSSTIDWMMLEERLPEGAAPLLAWLPLSRARGGAHQSHVVGHNFADEIAGQLAAEEGRPIAGAEVRGVHWA
jgi:hypothetical protein